MKGTKRIKKLKNAVPKESCNTLLEKKAASLLKNSRHKIRKHKKGKALSYITEVKEDCIHSALQEARECGNESSISIKKDEIKENILHTNNDAEINFQKSEKQLDWFISLFQASCNTRLSSLELQEIPENAMIKLPKSLDHQEENLSKHVKYIFGPKWKEVLCKPNLEDDILPGSPVLLVICSSAIRCMDVLRGLKELTASCHAAKLFAKHIKIEQQVEALKNRVNIAVGTPSRIMKLIENDALKISQLSVVMLDSYKDAKNQTLFSLPQVKDDFWKLYETHLHEQMMKGRLQLCLY